MKTQSVISLDPIAQRNRKRSGVIGRFLKPGITRARELKLPIHSGTIYS